MNKMSLLVFSLAFASRGIPSILFTYSLSKGSPVNLELIENIQFGSTLGGGVLALIFAGLIVEYLDRKDGAYDRLIKYTLWSLGGVIVSLAAFKMYFYAFLLLQIVLGVASVYPKISIDNRYIVGTSLIPLVALGIAYLLRRSIIEIIDIYLVTQALVVLIFPCRRRESYPQKEKLISAVAHVANRSLRVSRLSMTMIAMALLERSNIALSDTDEVVKANYYLLLSVMNVAAMPGSGYLNLIGPIIKRAGVTNFDPTEYRDKLAFSIFGIFAAGLVFITLFYYIRGGGFEVILMGLGKLMFVFALFWMQRTNQVHIFSGTESVSLRYMLLFVLTSLGVFAYCIFFSIPWLYWMWAAILGGGVNILYQRKTNRMMKEEA